MISIVESREPAALRVARLLVVLQRHLHGALNCRGAVVTEKHPGQGAGRLEVYEGLGEPGGRLIAKTERGNVGYFPQLLLQCGVQMRMAVTVQVRPDCRISIEIAFAHGIIEPHSLTPDDEKRLMVRGAPIPHLRERMPGMGFIPGCQEGKVVRKHAIQASLPHSSCQPTGCDAPQGRREKIAILLNNSLAMKPGRAIRWVPRSHA